MISTISQNTLSISVSVGQETRVRESQKPKAVETHGPTKEKAVEGNAVSKPEDSLNSKPGPEEIDKVVSRLQKTLQQVEPRIELSVDKELNQVIFRVVDKDSGELIRQIPSEEALKLDRFFADQSGLFVEEEV